MESSLIIKLLPWWNGRLPSKKTLAWCVSRLRRALLTPSQCGEIVAYDVSLFFFVWALQALYLVHLYFVYLFIFIEKEKIGRGLPCRLLKKFSSLD